MMMPANYSVIAENEMTYVNGGALIDCFAPLMNSSNWKTFNTNLIKIIGNSTMGKFLSSTVGVLFGGSFSFENWGDTLQKNYWVEDDIGNTVLSWVGALASIYTLGTADAKTLQGDKVVKIDGTTF